MLTIANISLHFNKGFMYSIFTLKDSFYKKNSAQIDGQSLVKYVGYFRNLHLNDKANSPTTVVRLSKIYIC